jgi:tetratricopeptide (TPR) repeat protein
LSSAQTPETLFDQGNNLYNSGSYEEAIKDYKQILELDIHSPELYFNLANAYYRIGKVAESVFYFEKAKLLDPENKDIDINLQFAQNMSMDSIEMLPVSLGDRVINSITSLYSVSAWAKILIGLSVILSLLFSLYLLNSNTVYKRIYFTSFWLLMGVFIFLFTLTYSRNEEKINQRFAIIFDTQVNILGEPNDRSEVLFILHEGTKTVVLDSLGSFYKIKIANGSEGWIETSSLKTLN